MYDSIRPGVEQHRFKSAHIMHILSELQLVHNSMRAGVCNIPDSSLCMTCKTSVRLLMFRLLRLLPLTCFKGVMCLCCSLGVLMGWGSREGGPL